MVKSEADVVEGLTRRRVRFATAMGIVLISTQGLAVTAPGSPDSLPNLIRSSAWIVWVAALMLFLVTGGGMRQSPRIRAILNDETTRDHRLRAFAAGFWAALAAAAIIYALTFLEDFAARAAIQIVVTTGAAATLLRFAALERRSLKDG